MSFFDTLKEKSAELYNDALKYKNSNFMHAVAAGCAMIARADGSVSDGEKQTMIRFIENFDALKVFKMIEVVKAFNMYLEQYEFSSAIGETKALEAIGKLKGKESESKVMLRIVIGIGNSDGNFDDKEKAVAIKICREVGLDPKDFDLV